MSAWYIASRIGIRSTATFEAPPPGRMPQFTSDRPNTASSAQNARSHAYSGAYAPPKHQPCTIAIVTFSKLRSRVNQPYDSIWLRRIASKPSASGSRKYSCRSMPADHASPLPPSTSTPTSSRNSSSSSTASIRRLSCRLIALRLSGRLNHTHAIPSLTS